MTVAATRRKATIHRKTKARKDIPQQRRRAFEGVDVGLRVVASRDCKSRTLDFSAGPYGQKVCSVFGVSFRGGGNEARISEIDPEVRRLPASQALAQQFRQINTRSTTYDFERWTPGRHLTCPRIRACLPSFPVPDLRLAWWRV